MQKMLLFLSTIFHLSIHSYGYHWWKLIHLLVSTSNWVPAKLWKYMSVFRCIYAAHVQLMMQCFGPSSAHPSTCPCHTSITHFSIPQCLTREQLTKVSILTLAGQNSQFQLPATSVRENLLHTAENKIA